MQSAKPTATLELCRVRAEACEKQAAMAANPFIKSAMLQFARFWRELAERRDHKKTAA
jgi:hypothetical protein